MSRRGPLGYSPLPDGAFWQRGYGPLIATHIDLGSKDAQP